MRELAPVRAARRPYGSDARWSHGLDTGRSRPTDLVSIVRLHGLSNRAHGFLEGKGIARRAWASYAGAVNKATQPALGPLIRRIAANKAADLLGFWLVWHLEGGFDGLLRNGMSRATIYRRIATFRRLTGKHPDEFELRGVEIDLAEYAKAARSQK